MNRNGMEVQSFHSFLPDVLTLAVMLILMLYVCNILCSPVASKPKLKQGIQN